MERLPMCRICLAENVRMYIVVNRNLHKLYEKLTDIPFITEDRRPILACFFCSAKLKQCYRLLRNCVIAEELFSQILNVNYEPNPLINPDLLVIFGGFVKTTTENISIDDVGQIESIAMKEELPADCEGLDDNIEPKEVHQSDELEWENLNNSHHDVADIQPPDSESVLEDELPLITLKTEVEEEQEVSKKKRRTRKTTRANVVKKPKLDTRRTKQDAITTEPTKKEKSNSKNIRKTKKRANVAKKPKLDTRRTKQDAIKTEPTKKEKSNSENIRKTKKRAIVTKKSNLEDAITAKQMKKEKSNPKVIRARATRKRTSKPGTHFKEPSKCDQRNLNGVKESIKHTRTRTGQKPKCDICQRSFIGKGLLINHIRIHTKEKPYKCEVCQRRFTEKGGLTKHFRIHTGEKRYKCHVCRRRFRGTDTLIRHIRIHTGEKPYKCHVCQRSFRESGNLTKHFRIHTGEKPYKCDICQHGFSEKGNLTKHKILMHSSENPYKCEICLKSFSDLSAVEVHLRVHT